jgi:N-acyl-L-homoserine lactone synthetase
MIVIYEGHQRQSHSELFDEMFRQRAVIFGQTLGWAVKIDEEGREIDEYDRDDTVYLMSLDSTGHLNGAVRFVSTVTDHMMTGPFQDMFPDYAVRSPVIWEATRFYTFGHHDVLANRVSHSACELLLGMCEFCLQSGIAQVVALMQSGVIRVYRRCGLSQKILARHNGEHGQTLLGLWTISRELLASMRVATGIGTSVLAMSGNLELAA